MGFPRDLWFDGLVQEYPAAEKYRTHVDRLVDDYFAEANQRADLEIEVESLREVVDGLNTRLDAYEDSERALKRRRSAVIDILTAQYEKASSYTNLVISLGYAAMIAVFTANAGLLTMTERRLAGCLLLTSLLFFVVWELYKMMVGGWLSKDLAAVVSSENFDLKLARHQARSGAANRRFAALWVWNLAICVPTGLGAGLLLIWGLFARPFLLA